jgi:hypothetical protein
MEKIDRVKTTLRGEAVDRPPYGFWTHMAGIDLDPARVLPKVYIGSKVFGIANRGRFRGSSPSNITPICATLRASSPRGQRLRRGGLVFRSLIASLFPSQAGEG